MGRKQEQWEVLLEELRAEFILREKQLELLHEIDLRLLQDERRLDETLAFITDRTRELVRSEHASIMLRRGRFFETTYSSDGVDIGQRLPVDGSIAGLCVAKHSTINIPDIATSEYGDLYAPIANYSGDAMKSLLETPIEMQDDAVGVLCLESKRTNAFSAMHVQIVEAVASQVAITLQRVQHFDREKLFSRLDRMMLDPSRSNEVIPAALTEVTDELRRLGIELSGAQILFQKGQNELEIVHSTNAEDIGLSVSIDKSICGRAVKERRTIVVGDVRQEEEYLRMLGANIMSEIAIPIILGNDIIGVLNVESEESDAFKGYYQIILDSFADKVRILLAIAKLRTDVTEALEVRQANDLLIAVGDQATNMIHRLNSTVGALRFRLIDLRDASDELDVEGSVSLEQELDILLELAEHALEIPDEVTRFLSEGGKVIDVNQAIMNTVNRIFIPENVVVQTDLNPGLPVLSLYSFEIVVRNLIKNAIDAMPDGGALTLSTQLVSHTKLSSAYVQVVVGDTGSGIAAGDLPHIFELRFSTKKDKGRGLGLGLWWVRNCVLRSGGDISVNSVFGRGSRFVIKIPVDLARSSREA
jgi:signal transduction histidine kinase